MMILGIVVIVGLIFIVISFVRQPDQRQQRQPDQPQQQPDQQQEEEEQQPEEQETEKERLERLEREKEEEEFKNYMNKASEGLTYTPLRGSKSVPFTFTLRELHGINNTRFLYATSVGPRYSLRPTDHIPLREVKSHLREKGVSEDILQRMSYEGGYNENALYYFDLREVLPIFYHRKKQLLLMSFAKLHKQQPTQEQKGLLALNKYLLEEMNSELIIELAAKYFNVTKQQIEMMIFRKEVGQWRKLRDKTDRNETEKKRFHDLSLSLLKHVQEKLDPEPGSYFARLAEEFSSVRTEPVVPVDPDGPVIPVVQEGAVGSTDQVKPVSPKPEPQSSPRPTDVASLE